MTVGDRLRNLFGGESIRVHVLIKGRIGAGWYDVDRVLRPPKGITLTELIEFGERRGLPFRDALEHSPHLRDTLMHNGERRPIATESGRVIEDGDTVYLLAPIAGG